MLLGLWSGDFSPSIAPLFLPFRHCLYRTQSRVEVGDYVGYTRDMFLVKIELLDVNFPSDDVGGCLVVDIEQVAVIRSDREFRVAQYVLKLLE